MKFTRITVSPKQMGNSTPVEFQRAGGTTRLAHYFRIAWRSL